MQNTGAVMKKTMVALLTIVFLVNIYLLLTQVFMQSKLPKVFGIAQVVVISGSMHPAIDAGDLLVIREQDEYKENDIITYRSGASLITHRVKSVTGTRIVAQGDANNVADAPIEISQVEGKMLFRIPQVGRIGLFLKTPLGILSMVVVGLMLFMIPSLADKRK